METKLLLLWMLLLKPLFLNVLPPFSSREMRRSSSSFCVRSSKISSLPSPWFFSLTASVLISESLSLSSFSALSFSSRSNSCFSSSSAFSYLCFSISRLSFTSLVDTACSTRLLYDRCRVKCQGVADSRMKQAFVRRVSSEVPRCGEFLL